MNVPGGPGSRRGALVAAMVLVGLACVACRAEPAPASPVEGRTTVHLGDDPWTLLFAGPDGMRRLPDFDGADGMLFDFGKDVEPSAVVFVMDRVAFPLDIAWFGANGEPVGSATMAVCLAQPCPTYAPDVPYRWAIEAPVGAFASLAPGAPLRAEP